MYIAVRIRGTVSVGPKPAKTLEFLNLRRANNASIWPENESSRKMLKSVEHMITFGKADEATLAALLEKRGEAIEGKLDVKKAVSELSAGKTATQAGVVNCFKLSPPKGGYERKGIKKPYSEGGAYGERKKEIGKLVMRML